MLDHLSERDALVYLCRSSGLVLMLVFTATVVLGLLTAGRAGPPRCPRFVAQSLHRNLALISLTLLLVHLAAPIIGGYLGLKLAYAFVPFLPAPVRIWTRAAATATDLVVLISIVNVARVHAGYRFWRAVHLTSYVAWALGIVHATGIGTDHGSVLGCDAVCVLAVGLAGWYRLAVRRQLARERAP